MDRRLTWSALPCAIATVFMCASFANAQCDSGGCDVGGYANGGYQIATAPGSLDGCATPASCGSAGCGFGYPGGNCTDGCAGGGCGLRGGIGHHNGPFRQHACHLMNIHRRDYARNQAWPKPFDCADRQLYFSIWETMLDSGYRWNCLFTADHFDADTNMLNEVGKSKLAGIFKNNPVGQKVALVQNDGNGGVLEARVQNLRSTIDKWYGNGSFNEVALATEFPTTFGGARVENLNKKFGDETPPPVIPVASGSGSTSDVGVGQ